jgi:hypothetical protein
VLAGAIIGGKVVSFDKASKVSGVATSEGKVSSIAITADGVWSAMGAAVFCQLG